LSTHIQIPSSRLPEPRQRFLAHVVQHGLSVGLRQPEEFLNAFPAMTIMLALAEHPTRRARILEQTTGVRARVALRKTPDSCGIDLQIALDEGETDAATVLSLFEPDDRIQFLENSRLWSYVVSPRFWEPGSVSDTRRELVLEHTVLTLVSALEESLVTPLDIIEAISPSTLVDYLPPDVLKAVLEHALGNGRSGKAFTDDDFLDTAGVATLVAHVPLEIMWESVIRERIARPNELLEGSESPPPVRHTEPSRSGSLDIDGESLFDESEAHPDTAFADSM